MELSDKLYSKITSLCEAGDEYCEKEQYEKAIKKYESALKLIPEPKYDWEASTWVYVAIGDSFYMLDQYTDALNNFLESLKCPDGNTNPFILLRLGECYYELGNFEQAKEYLLRAFMWEGEDIFDGEDEKYFALIKDMVNQ